MLSALCWVGYRSFRQNRRRRLFSQPTPDHQIEILKNNVPLYSRLPLDLQQELHGLVNVFLDEKQFVAYGDLAITDEVSVTIAGNACILLLNKNKLHFPRFKTIIVYPDTIVITEMQDDGILTTHQATVRSGESWYRGPVVLSWSDIVYGIKNPGDGHNVVLHEFAHKLDEENNIMDGLPVLRDAGAYKDWAEVLTKEYDEFLKRVSIGQNRVMDEYGAISAAEFFAVATESFFEKSDLMADRLPELYQQLKLFYNLDPRVW